MWKDIMSWDVFQKDVLDALEGYVPFFYRFERMKDLKIGKRVEAVAVIKREGKHEVWIVDAKFKPLDAINHEDVSRMDNYENSIKKTPEQVGLSKEEFYKYKIFKIFVYQGPGEFISDNYTLYIPFEKLHAFCEKNLVILDSDYVVQHISQLASKGMLSDSQVSLLYSGLKPYEEVRRDIISKLQSLSENLVAATLIFPPFDNQLLPKGTPEISALLSHKGRNIMFPIIIPYNKRTIKESTKRMKLVYEKLSKKSETIPIVVDSFSEIPKSRIPSRGVIFTHEAFSYFEEVMPKYVIHKDLLQWYIIKELRVIPIEKILPYLTFRNIEMSITKSKGSIQIRDTHDFGFFFSLETEDDINFHIFFRFPFDLDQSSTERLGKVFTIAKVDRDTVLSQTFKVMFECEYYKGYRYISDLRVEIEQLDEFHALSFYGQQIMEPEVTLLGKLVQSWLVKKVGIKQ